MVFREESGGNNERIGQYRFELDNTFYGQINLEYISLFITTFISCFQYFCRSYIDDTGKTITVKYSAGINGFR